MTIQPKGADMLVRLMSAATTRRDVLANNIASQNLPGYHRQDVEFEKLLFEQMQKGGDVQDLKDVRPEIVTDWDTPVRADGNNVDMEVEMTSLALKKPKVKLIL